MPTRKEPQYAPGQELTLHPGDPVRGAELLEANRADESDLTEEDRRRQKRGQGDVPEA